VYRYHLAAFVLSGTIAALAGVLTAQHVMFISPEMANWLVSGDVLIAVIIGGMGTLIGPVLGSAILVVLRDTLSSHVHYWYFCLGLVFIFTALFTPQGICGLLLRASREPGTRRVRP
jgi:branched-chain amino acid transport system permease protein